MRVVLDTNVLVSALLAPDGLPRRLLNGARAQTFELCISTVLLAELLDVLQRDKFAARFHASGLSPHHIVTDLRRLSVVVAPHEVPRIIAEDADDDHVLACALTGRAQLIVSGDRHLHSLGGDYQGIAIVHPAQAVQQLGL